MKTKINVRKYLISFIFLSIFISDNSIQVFAQEGSDFPSNPISGRIVFEEKRCMECHAIDGYGGNLGPDLGREKYFGSFYDLASRLWNHAPQMAVRSDFMEKDWPTMTKSEIKQLTSYLFYLRFLGEPGSVSKGRDLLESKNCMKCHKIENYGAKNGISLDKIQEFASPLFIAQVIWNHGPKMQKKMVSMGIDRPEFEDGDITHITAFLREYNLYRPTKKRYMSPGNPQRGEAIFQEKGCGKCHSIIEDEQSSGTPLSEINLHRSVTSIAGAMWNHGNIMFDAMREKKIDWPKFRGSEMGDLISYLYFFDYKGKAGNPELGEKVLKSKSCINCHGVGADFEMSGSLSLKEPADLIMTMWNHVPHMQEEILLKNLDWPELSAEDLQNLYSYLITQ